MKKILGFCMALLFLVGICCVSCNKATPDESGPSVQTESVNSALRAAGTDKVTPDSQTAIIAVHSGECGDNLTWTLDGNGLLTISGTGKMRPKNYDGTPPWYDYRDSIISVRIDNGVTGIRANTFRNCHALTSIEIPASVTSIGENAFWYCSALTSITIPDGVTSIGEGAFEGCSALTGVTIPAGITSIGARTFSGCSALTSVTIPDGVTSIGQSAFGSCSAFTSITIPAGVTSIEDYAFCSCRSLESIQVNENNPNYTSVDGVLYSKDKAQLICCPAGRKNGVEISDSVTRIRDGAFYGCSALTSVTIPVGVTGIGKGAFCGCGSLTNITLPDSVTSIEHDSFDLCYALTICGSSGSYAQEYASKLRIPFALLDTPTDQSPCTGPILPIIPMAVALFALCALMLTLRKCRQF